MGYVTQFWDVDSCDWRYYSKTNPLSLGVIMDNCKQAKDGDIVLCHDLPVTARNIIPFYVNSSDYQMVVPV